MKMQYEYKVLLAFLALVGIGLLFWTGHVSRFAFAMLGIMYLIIIYMEFVYQGVPN